VAPVNWQGGVHPAVLLTWPDDRNAQVFWVRVAGWATQSVNDLDDRLAVVTANRPGGDHPVPTGTAGTPHTV